MTGKKPKSKKGYIHVYTGDGGGKTTAALGVAMRAIGHGKRVAMVQFMKGRKDIGEWKVQKKLRDFAVYQFGRKGFVNMKKPSAKDIELANQALGFAGAELFEKRPPDLLILDEINLAAALGMVDVKDVLEMLSKMPKEVDVYLTGRRAPDEFIKAADFVTEVEDRKRKKINARKGIDY